jgi:transcriptional regulator with XRE-family HTH domain
MKWQYRREMAPGELADFLRDRGLRQLQLADYLDIGERTLRRYLTGEAPIPVPIVLLLRSLMWHEEAPVAPILPPPKYRQGLPD